MVVYELLHPLLGKRIGPWDIIATMIAGTISEIVFRSLHRRLSKNAKPGARANALTRVVDPKR